MRRRVNIAFATIVAVAGLGVLGAVLAGEGKSDGGAAAHPATRATTASESSRGSRVTTSAASRGREVQGARLLRRAQLRARPGGRVVRALGTRTNFGSQQVLAVVGRRGDWLAVLSHHLPNSRAGWIPAASAKLVREPYTLHADLSARTVVVRREGRVVRRVRVDVGRPGSTTPTGRFAVTDMLRLAGGGPYGCCVLALTGRQPNVPQGWTGGNRLAIHGRSSADTIGTAASAGCLRAREADMRWLLAHVRLGAPVRITS